MNSVAMATQEVEFLLNNPRNNKKPKFRKSILVFKSFRFKENKYHRFFKMKMKISV